MRTATVLMGLLAVTAMQQVIATENEKRAIPSSCPVTRSTPETRFTPPLRARSHQADTYFWFGSDSLYTELASDGRWRGIKSRTGTRNKSFWFRKDAEWLRENPYQLLVTATQLDSDAQMIKFPRVTNAIMGEEVAMLLMLELPKRGCWQVTANYKSDYVSFVTWVD